MNSQSNNMTTCWRHQFWWWLLLSFSLSFNDVVFGSQVEKNEKLDFHPEYWNHLEKAIRYAKCVENEVFPTLDELSLIMKPASCRKDATSNQRCNKCIQEVNGTKAPIPGFYRDVDPPMPLFHCNSHGGISQQDFKTHYRIEYPTVNHHPPVTLSRDTRLHPRVFVVEKEVDGKWEAVLDQPYWFFSLDTKTNSTYRVRITAVSAHHVYYPQLSDPITIYDANNQKIGTPKNFRVVATQINRKAARIAPTVTMRWESGSGLNASCDWDVYYLEDVQTKIERSKPEEAFWVTIDKIQFKKTYIINIMEKFGYGRESDIAQLSVPIESCLAVANYNFSLCSPPPPTNVRVENETLDSFWIAWDGFYDKTSASQISSYSITVDKFSNDNDLGMYSTAPLFQTSVPGNQTRVEVNNITGPGSLRIVIVARSDGGKSDEWVVVHHLKGDVSWTKSLEQLWVIIVIPIILLMAIIFGYVVFKSFRNRLHRNREVKKKWKKLKLDDEMLTQQVERYSSKWEIDFGNIILGDVVGKGQFGEVRKATLYRKGCKTTVAVKTLRVHPDTTSGDYETEDGSLAKEIIDNFFRDEFEILKIIDTHVHVVQLVGIVREPTPALITEFCDGGDLQSHLRKASPMKVDKRRSSPCPSMMGSTVHLQPNEVRVQLSMVTNEAYFMKNDAEYFLTPLDLLSYARQVACGMEFLSNNKIIHRDLAARNILISGKNRVLKIADFGLSRDIYEQNWYKKRSNGKIPIKWLALECLMKEVYTSKSDVWSYGILLWEIVTFGATPYPGIENQRIYDILKGGYRMTRPDNCSKEIYELMTQCWNENPTARSDFTVIRRKLEGLIGKSGEAYLNLESPGSVQYSELLEPGYSPEAMTK